MASDLLLRCRASSLVGVDDERDEVWRSLIGPICPSESGRLLRNTLSNSEGPVGWNPLCACSKVGYSIHMHTHNT